MSLKAGGFFGAALHLAGRREGRKEIGDRNERVERDFFDLSDELPKADPGHEPFMLPQVRHAIEPLKPIDRLAMLDRVEFPGHKVAQQSPERLERLGRPKRLKAFERLGRPIVQGEERRRLAHLFDIEMDGEGERLLERPIRLFADHGARFGVEWDSGIGSVRPLSLAQRRRPPAKRAAFRYSA